MLTRVLFSDNGVLSDISTELDDYKNGSKSLSIVAAEDAIYIGAYYPFNAKFFKIDSRNDVVGPPAVVYSPMIPVIKYWSGSNGWKSAVEVIDETNGLKQSGFISWTPNKDFSWSREDSNDVAELSSKTIYDLFWIKLTFSVDGTVNFKWVGEMFSNDSHLGAEFPDLLRSQTLTSFESGKTDWEHQHVIAAKVIIDDLKTKKIISHKEQILDRREFTLAAVQKCASIIYSSFGDDYIDNKKACDAEYAKRINKDIFNVDKEETAIPTTMTIAQRQWRFTR